MREHDGAHEAAQTQPVDWGKVHRRLELAREAVEAEARSRFAFSKKVLKERAKALAKPPGARGKASDEFLEVVEFNLANERYGIESRYVREVDAMKDLTPVPCTPLFVLGVVNIRGQILSVIDLKRLFDLPEKGLTELDRIIVVRDGAMEFGIHADSVLGVRRIEPKELQRSIAALSSIREELLMGVTGDRLIVLDAGRLLASKELVVHEKVEM